MVGEPFDRIAVCCPARLQVAERGVGVREGVERRDRPSSRRLRSDRSTDGMRAKQKSSARWVSVQKSS